MKDKSEKAVTKTDQQWKGQLTDMQYYVTRKGGTERAFTGELTDHFAKGKYRCICCEQLLFESETKFHSGCGWPSFYGEVEGSTVHLDDHSFGMHRTEIRCSQCDAHLGHIFGDGPKPTGMRYCINSAAIKFDK